MSSSSKSYIHGSTDAREVARLEKQARFVWRRMMGRAFEATPGERVLDLATGVGAMAGQILEHHPGIRLVGVDLRISQLRSARENHPGPAWVNADGTALPFADQSFDRVHCSWLLEHVTEPLNILREVRRVLRDGGVAYFIEVDNATFRPVGGEPGIGEVMDALNDAQVRGGGDPFIGQKLEALFRDAGFRDVQSERTVLDGTHADPPLFQEIVEEFAEIFESLDEAVDPQMAERAQRAAASLRALLHTPGAELHYAGVFARGTR